MAVVISFGPGNSITDTEGKYQTVSQVRADTHLRAILGFGDNSRFLVDDEDGVEVIPDGAVVRIVSAGNQKAN